jgi:hypothetical protein
MRVCYLDCYEAGLGCYILILIDNLLRSLQMLYFHLCPIYWLFLIILNESFIFCFRVAYMVNFPQEIS